MTQPAFAAPVCVEVVITAGDADVLATITRTLVEERFAAYAYNTTSVSGIFHRGGEVVEETQARALLHTRATLVSDIVDRLGHEYAEEVRSVVASQLIDGRSDYLRWVARETSADVDHHIAAARRRAERRTGTSRWSWDPQPQQVH